MNGAYLLIIKVKKPNKIKVGKLGKIEFEKGYYVYVGSALKNLEKRVERHFKKEKKIKWHIDYLLASKFAFLEFAIVFSSKKKIECKISRLLEKFANSLIKNFGSSDCKCKSHLYYFKSLKELKNILNKI
jgi:Uri superfamily endonuclease